MKALRLAIHGGGPASLALVEAIAETFTGSPEVRLLGVADPDPDAPALARARSLNIFTTVDPCELLLLEGLNLLVELSEDSPAAEALRREKPEQLPVLGRELLPLLYGLLRSEGRRLNAEHKSRDLFDNAREGIVFCTLEGGILDGNFSLALMLGYSRAELRGLNVAELAAGFSKRILRDHLAGLRSLGTSLVEMDFRRKDRTLLPVECDVTWVPQEKHFRMTVRDISLKQKLEESKRIYAEALERDVRERTRALQVSEEEARRQRQTAEGIISGSPIPMYVLNRDHRVIYWNRACESLTGCASGEMVGTNHHWKPFYPRRRPVLADLVIDNRVKEIERRYGRMQLRRSAVVEGAFEAEHFFPELGPAGSHLYMNAAPIRDETGEIQGAIVTFQDFSERVRMTQQIRRREIFVQNLIQNSIDGILATDERGKIVICNRGAVEILGYRPEDILGRLSYQDILSEANARSIREAFYGNRYGPPDKIINMEIQLLNRSDESIPVRFSGALLYEEGKEVGSVVFIQDLREIHRLQREKEQAQRMAAIGRTVAGLAHYIKNILMGLQGGAYVIRSGSAKKDLELVTRGWAMVERNIEQIANVVTDMLIYSKERQPKVEPVDPNDLVREILEMMGERAKLSGVRIVADVAPGLPPVPMERDAVYRGLLNLVGNAIDACTLQGLVNGKGLVKVSTGRAPGWGVRFQVSDNGIGMDEETQRRLFTDFFSTKGYKGTGLGLPVTQKIVHEHGGQLIVESRVGEGATFTVLLPAGPGEGNQGG